MKTFAAISIASSLLLSTATAQEQYQINPDSVTNATRQAWCTSQKAQCPLICSQVTTDGSSGTEQNDCDPDQLTYACVCDNGLSPNVTEYSQTLPFLICSEWGTQCVSNCDPANSSCASNCRTQHPCGAQNPVRQNTSTLSSTMSKSATTGGAGASTTGESGGVYSGFAGASSTGGGAAASASAGGAPSMRVAALNVGQTFGVLGLIGALFGGFAVLL